LTTVSRRFDDAALLEAILSPSRSIADSYRNTVVLTDEEERVEGRVVVEDAAVLTLLLSDGSRRTIERNHVASTRPSELSPMPEGLLAASTLEEVKDLFAYLRAEGKVDPADAARPGWTAVLVGPQRSGWTYDPSVWRAPNGVLVGRGATLERSSYFLSKASHADFEVEFDVRMPTGNSGFQYRSTVDPSKPDPNGYQADIGQGYWGSLYVSDGRGIASQADPKAWVPALDREGWNHFLVHVEGDRHVIELNGLVTTDFRDAAFTSGVLGFQVHEKMDMEVRFANVRLRDLR
jgi:putative heme-binding domain-containing protein